MPQLHPEGTYCGMPFGYAKQNFAFYSVYSILPDKPKVYNQFTFLFPYDRKKDSSQ